MEPVFPQVPPYGESRWSNIPACSLTGMCLLRLKVTARTTDSVAIKILIPVALILAVTVTIPFDFIATPLCTSSLKAWLKGTVASITFLLTLPFRLLPYIFGNNDFLFPVSWRRECAGAPHPMVVMMRLGGCREDDMEYAVLRHEESREEIYFKEALIPLVTGDELLLRCGYSDNLRNSLQEIYSLLDILRRRPLHLRGDGGRFPNQLSEQVRQGNDYNSFQLCRLEDILQMARQSASERNAWFSQAVIDDQWEIADALYMLNGGQGGGLWYLEDAAVLKFFRRAVAIYRENQLDEIHLVRGLNVVSGCYKNQVWFQLFKELFETFEKDGNFEILERLLEADEKRSLQTSIWSYQNHRQQIRPGLWEECSILRTSSLYGEKRQDSLLHRAIQGGHSELIALLKARLEKIDPHFPLFEYFCYFVQQVEKGRFPDEAESWSVGDALWDDGWKSARFEGGHTLLTYAVCRGSERLVRYFVRKGADTNLLSQENVWGGSWVSPSFGKTPYSLAKEKGLKILADLIEPGRWEREKRAEEEEEQRRQEQQEQWRREEYCKAYGNSSVIPLIFQDFNRDLICPVEILGWSLEELQKKVALDCPSPETFKELNKVVTVTRSSAYATRYYTDEELSQEMGEYRKKQIESAKTLFQLKEQLRRARESFEKACSDQSRFDKDIALKPFWEIFGVSAGDLPALDRSFRKLNQKYHADKYRSQYTPSKCTLHSFSEHLTIALIRIKEFLQEVSKH